MVREFVRDELIGRGYQVLEAASGDEALRRYGSSDETIHLLLTDVVMPGINGRELAERMTDIRPDLKVIFMSGFTSDITLDGDRWTHANFLQKPFAPSALGLLLRQTLDAQPGH